MPAPVTTVDRLLERMRERGDFPAMASTVGQISHLTSSEDTSTTVLAETVLQDYGVAQKLLRLVNTAAFAQRDQVTTISRAVLLLGFERVRSVATGLILFEHLQAQATTPALVDALIMSFYSAILGRAIAEGTKFVDVEEAFISALFHNLGRILAALYLPDEVSIINASDGDTDVAVHSVLGMSYSALGIGVASTLKLPTKLAHSLTRVSGSQSRQSMTDSEKLACVSTLANKIADALAASTSARDKRDAINALVASYGAHFAALNGKIDGLIGSSVTALRRHSSIFRHDLPTPLVVGLGEWRLESLLSEPGVNTVAAASPAGGLLDVAEPNVADEVPETVLTRGLHEITSLLVTDFSLDDVLRVILETIYCALGVGRTRTLFLLKDASAPVAHFKFGLGLSTNETRGWHNVPLTGGDDVFSASMRQHKDVVITDTAAPEVRPLLPDWYRVRLSDRRYVVLLPLAVDQRTLGLFYVDGDHANVKLLTPALLNYLKVLRGQAVVAIHHRAARPGARRT
jgi:eukaryotic-like serine/threonine-protein kinase